MTAHLSMVKRIHAIASGCSEDSITVRKVTKYSVTEPTSNQNTTWYKQHRMSARKGPPSDEIICVEEGYIIRGWATLASGSTPKTLQRLCRIMTQPTTKQELSLCEALWARREALMEPLGPLLLACPQVWPASDFLDLPNLALLLVESEARLRKSQPLYTPLACGNGVFS